MTVFTAGDRTPFTYLIKCIPTGEVYYGVRYAVGCQPTDLWSIYFTSSKKIHDRINIFGKDSFKIQIRKTFSCAIKARYWEHTVLRRLKVTQNRQWLNNSLGIMFSHRSKKGLKSIYLISENRYIQVETELAELLVTAQLAEMKGPPKLKSHREKISKSLKGRKKSINHIQKIVSSFNNNPHTSGFKVYTNGCQNIRVREGQDIPEGYYVGSKTKEISTLNVNQGKTYEEIYGVTKAIELKQIRSEHLKHNNPSIKMKDRTYEDLYGEKKAKELKEKRSITGKLNRKEFIIYQEGSLLFSGSRQEAEKFLCENFSGRKDNNLYRKDLLDHYNLKVETRRKLH